MSGPHSHLRLPNNLESVTYFAAPIISSLSCFPLIHHDGKSYEVSHNFILVSNLGWIITSSLILLSRSILAIHRFALSSVMASTKRGVGGYAVKRQISCSEETVHFQVQETSSYSGPGCSKLMLLVNEIKFSIILHAKKHCQFLPKNMELLRCKRGTIVG